MEDNDLRKNDVLVGELKGMFEQFIVRYEQNTKEASEWRREVERKIGSLEEFLNEIRTPHKYMIFALKAIALTAITGILAILGNYIREHMRWL